MQRREYQFKFVNASEGQYANNLDPERPAATFQVKLIGAGAVLDNGQQQGTYYEGDTCTVSAAAGYNVTSLAIEGGSTITQLPYTFMVSRNTNITVTAVPKSFADYTWSEIDAACKAGLASTLFAVGDEKDIELSTGEVITVLILGFNHDDLSDGSGKASMTIGMKNLLATLYRMNATSTNAGGWDESEMRTSTMATLLSQLPSDLQSVIKQVNKKATAGGKSTSITTSADKLWLFSEVEVDGTTSAGYADEGKRYEYWKTVKDGTVAADRIKYSSNGSGSPYSWWLRSPDVSYSAYVRIFSSTGGVNIGDAYNMRGVSFGFCV